MSQNINSTTRQFKIQSYFDSCKSSTDLQWNEKCTDLQWNEKCKNYIELDQLKKIKRQRVDLKEI